MEIPPTGSHVLHTQCFVNTKTVKDGKIVRYKARLAYGNEHLLKVNCGNNFAAVMELKVVLVLARKKGVWQRGTGTFQTPTSKWTRKTLEIYLLKPQGMEVLTEDIRKIRGAR